MRREQRDHIIVADFHDFGRVGPGTLSFTHRYIGSLVLAKNICIPFGLRNWLLRISGDLLKVLVPLGIKFGSKVYNLTLKSICLGAKVICLNPQAVRFARVAQLKVSEYGESDCRHRN